MLSKALFQPSFSGTDITGFDYRPFGRNAHIATANAFQVTLEGDAIPALPGALDLLIAGHASSLAPANRRSLQLLDPQPNRNRSAAVKLNLGSIKANTHAHRALLELMVDPQTCGPLLISAAPPLAEALLNQDPHRWRLIGSATPA